MAELSDEDKRSLLGPNYREIEARAALRQRSAVPAKLKVLMIVAGVVALGSAVLLADLGFAFHW